MAGVVPFPRRPRTVRLDVELPAGAESNAVEIVLRAATSAPSLAFPDISTRYVGGGKTGCRYEIAAPCETSLEQLKAIAECVEQAAQDALPGCVVKVPPWLKRATRWHVETASEFMNGPPLEWLIDGVMPQAEFGTLYGPPGSGKSFLALDLAASLQRGLPWAGHETDGPRRAVIVAAEGEKGMRDRFKAYALRHGLDPDRDMPGGLAASPDLRIPQDVSDLSATLSAFGVIDLLILDTWAAMQPGADENSSKDAGAVLAACKRLSAEHGCMVLAVAHVGKDASRGERGWSGVRAAADVAIEVQRDASGNRSWIVRKMKDGEELSAQPFSLVPLVVGQNRRGKDIVSCTVSHEGNISKALAPVRQTRNKQLLHEVLEAGEARLVRDVIAEIIEAHPETKSHVMRRTIKRFVDSGFLVSRDGGKTVSLGGVVAEEARDGDWPQSA